MNGTTDPNHPEAGGAGAYTGAASHQSTGGQTGSAPANADYGYASGAVGGRPYYAGEPGSMGGSTGSAQYAPYPPPPEGSVPPPPGYVPPAPGYAPPYGYAAPMPPVPGSPNPGLAVLLGFIPGVGAMYNGQFAKGIAHIVIFAILTSLANHVSDAFGLLVAGWIFYMVFDAYQTARARREGMVAPDPFGLNNIGERFGMPTNPNWGDFMARPAAGGTSAAADPARTSNPYAGPPVDPATATAVPPYAASAAYGYAAPNVAGAPYAPPVPPPPYTPGTMPPPWHPDYAEAVRRQTVADMGGAPSTPYQSTYAPVDPAAMPPYPPVPVSSGIPMGAIWLIGLGLLALVGTLAHSFYWRVHFLGAFSCFVFGAMLLVQQTSITRKLYARGTAAYQWSLLHQARLGLILIVIGILQTLAGAHVAPWHYLWPYLLILLGLLQLADRSLYNRMLLDPPVFPNGYASANPVSAATAPTSASTGSSSAAATVTTEGEVR